MYKPCLRYISIAFFALSFSYQVKSQSYLQQSADADENLMKAALKGSSLKAGAALGQGAAVDAHDIMGSTPLHRAVFSGDISTIKLLLRMGACINEPVTLTGYTPLIVAAIFKLPTVTQFLINKGADIERPDNDGLRPLHMATFSPSSLPPYSSNSISIMKMLLDHKADIEARSSTGSTPLMFALFNQDNAAALWLIKKGASLFARNNDGETPLIVAIRYGASPKTVKTMLDNGAEINAQDNRGNTPLIFSIMSKDTGREANKSPNISPRISMYNDPRIIKMLLDEGASVNAREETGETALSYAQEKKDYAYKLGNEKLIDLWSSIVKMLEEAHNIKIKSEL